MRDMYTLQTSDSESKSQIFDIIDIARRFACPTMTLADFNFPTITQTKHGTTVKSEVE